MFFVSNQNCPNPFIHNTHISYALPHSSTVKLTVCNASGESVRTIVNKHQESGYYRVRWNGRDKNGTPCAFGGYFSRIEVRATGMNEGYTAVEKMLPLK